MENIFDAAKEKFANLTESTINLLNQDVMGSMKEYGMEKLNDVWKQIEGASDVFKRTGYSITELDINLALPPTILLHFDQIQNIGDDEEAKLLEENKSSPVLYSILVALFKANAVQQSINTVQYKFSGLIIGLGITLSIDMKFKKID